VLVLVAHEVLVLVLVLNHSQGTCDAILGGHYPTRYPALTFRVAGVPGVIRKVLAGFLTVFATRSDNAPFAGTIAVFLVTGTRDYFPCSGFGVRGSVDRFSLILNHVLTPIYISRILSIEQ
jgi:hypothetical protein